jgi:ferritin-like protein
MPSQPFLQENISIDEDLTNILQSKQDEHRELTDLELLCQIIRVFYKHPVERYMTVQEIFSCLSGYIKTERFKIAAILEVMVNAPICSKMIRETVAGEVTEVQYRWAIRSGGPGTGHEGPYISG